MSLSPTDVAAIRVTLQLATATTAVLLVLGTPLAWWLARTGSRWRPAVEAVTALPLVLPPTVLGFYLLVLLAPRGPVGAAWAALGGDRLVFSFGGLLAGSVLYSLPFVVQPLQNAFLAIGDEPLEAAATLGASPLDRFVTVALPLARPGFLTAATLAFAHTVGEFGVVLMVGGNIPGRTQVVSIAIYNHVEALEYGSAHLLAGGLTAFGFAVLLTVYALGRRFEVPRL
jgi:molybdate transport system permease protein